MKKRKHPRDWDDDTWMGSPQQVQEALAKLENEIRNAPYAMEYDPILDDPEALTEYIKKNIVRKVPIDATPTHDVSFMKREQMDGFAQIADWFQKSQNDPNSSPKRREQLIALYRQMSHDLQKAISHKQRLEYSIPEYDFDFVLDSKTLYPWDYAFDVGCNYNAYSLLPNGHVVFQGSGTDRPIKPYYLYVVALIQNKSDFSPSHLQAFIRVKREIAHKTVTKLIYLPSLDKTSILQFAKTLGFTGAFAQSFHTFLLQNVAFSWGNVPSFLPPKKYQRTCFHPATYILWWRELRVRTHLTQDRFINKYRRTDFFKDFNKSLSFYDRNTQTGGAPAWYMHPYPPVVHLL